MNVPLVRYVSQIVLGVVLGVLLVLGGARPARIERDRWHARYDGLVASVNARCAVALDGSGVCGPGSFVFPTTTTTSTTSKENNK